MTELHWIEEARKHIGLYENTASDKHNPTILKWLKDMGSFNGENKAWWNDDETPWCGLFVGHCLGVSGRYVIPDWYRAKAWLDESMQHLLYPAYGCIAIFNREGGGHVGFVVGKDSAGNIMILGGNQSNKVSIRPFSKERVSGYRWPSYYKDNEPKKSSPLLARYNLPTLASNGIVSVNEK